MPRNKEETEGLSLLGNKKTVYKDTYAPEVLETFVNKHQGNDYMVTFDCPEFTSLCPITGQPDFAKITINYIPNVKMVESKSLKLYLFSFRNQGDFHEDCINIIMKDLVKLMEPKYLEVKGIFTPRISQTLLSLGIRKYDIPNGSVMHLTYRGHNWNYNGFLED